MYITPLSPVLEESLMRSDKSFVSILQAADTTSLKNILNEKAIDALMRHETMLVVIDDTHDISLPAKLLSTHKLGHLCLLWNDDEALSEEQLSRFHILKDLHALPLETHAYDHARLKISGVQKNVSQSLRGLHQPILGQQTMKSLIQTCADNGIPPRAWTTGTFPESSMNETLKVLDQLEALYDQQFTVWSALGLFDRSLFLTNDAREELSNGLTRHKEEFRQLLDELNALYQNVRYRIEEKIWHECDLWFELSNQLEDLYYTMENTRSFAAWDDEVDSIRQKLKASAFLKYDQLNIDVFDWDKTPEYVQNIRQYLADSADLKSFHTKEFFKRWTPFNTEHEGMGDFLERTKKAIQALNDLPHFTVKIEPDILLIDVLRRTLETIHRQIESGLYILADEAFLEFSKLKLQHGISDDILAQCERESPAAWATTYFGFAMHQMIQTQYDPSLRRLKGEMTMYAKLTEEKQELVLKTVHNTWFKQKETTLGDLKKKNQDLYNILFVNQHTSLSVKNIYYNDPLFLQSFYPILCIHAKDLAVVLENNTAHWDHIVFFENSALTQTLLPYQESNIFIGTSVDLDVDTLMTNYPCKYYYSAEIHIDYPRPFGLIGRSERYKQAVCFASCLSSVIDRFSVFQLRGKSCISLLNPDLFAMLTDRLPADQLNILYENVNDTEALVEAMINPESSVHVLIENHLLNDLLPESLGWQMEIQDWLDRAGVIFHNILTDDLRQQQSGALSSIIEELVRPVVEQDWPKVAAGGIV